MTSIRNLGYAALLAMAIFNYAPSSAAAEEPSKGRFTLAHDVRWESASIPAGDYEFSYDPNNVSPVLTISKMSGARSAFMLMVSAKEASATSDSNVLVLESTAAGSFVSAMHLPESGVTLRFWVPRSSEKQLAKAETALSTSGQ